jgi:hypothetical protein
MFSSSTHNVSVSRNALEVLFLPVICLDCSWRRLSLVSSLPQPGRIKTRQTGPGRLRGGFFLTTTSLPWSPCSPQTAPISKIPPLLTYRFCLWQDVDEVQPHPAAGPGRWLPANYQLPATTTALTNLKATQSFADHVKFTRHKAQTNESLPTPSPPIFIGRMTPTPPSADVRVPIHVCDNITDAGTGNLATRLSTCMSAGSILSCHGMLCRAIPCPFRAAGRVVLGCLGGVDGCRT